VKIIQTSIYEKNLLIALALIASVHCGFAQQTKPTKTFIDYFLPTPIVGTLSKDVWGAATVGPRDPKNGLEDVTMKQWDYWDGKILKGPDGKYHMFCSRWEQARGHRGWSSFAAATSRCNVVKSLFAFRQLPL